MVYQPPAGARDLLPTEVAEKIWIERRLQDRFKRWGYHRIITSTLERLDTLMAGGAIQRSTVLQLQSQEEEELGLRPELTASIARAAVTRMAGNEWPLRLYYTDNVFRRQREAGHGSQQEFYQAGIELLGAGDVTADAEILLLLSECLESVGLSNWHLILGEAGLTRSLLEPFPSHLRHQIRHAIAHLDRVALERPPLANGLSDKLKEWAFLLFDLRGRPQDVLARVAQFELDDSQRQALNHLKSLIELLTQLETQSVSSEEPSVKLTEKIRLDLSLLQTFDYYTGIVFEAVSDAGTALELLGRGGRYDHLLRLYDPQGRDHPGIGFSVFIENLQQVLLSQHLLPKPTSVTDYLVVPRTAEAQGVAFQVAQTLRQSADLVRVEIDVVARETPEAVRDYATRRRISKLVWVSADGSQEIESLA